MSAGRRAVPAAILALAASCGGAPPPAAVTVKGKRIEVSVVATEKERRSAPLLFKAAGEDRGHLISWPRERFFKLEPEHAQAAFDVAALDRSGKILEILSFAPLDAEGLVPRAEAAHALFLAPGLLRKLGAGPGDVVALPPEAASARELPVVRIGDSSAFVELALTEADRQHGLMFRPRLSADDGMLFAYSEEAPRGFWMKNTLIPLDIAYFRQDGTLVNVNETPTVPDPRAGPWPSSPSDGPARFVLEMNRGWFRRRGLTDESGRPRPGLRAEFPPEAVRGFFP